MIDIPVATGSIFALPYRVTRWAWMLVGVIGSPSVLAEISHSPSNVPQTMPPYAGRIQLKLLSVLALRVYEMPLVSMTLSHGSVGENVTVVPLTPFAVAVSKRLATAPPK